MKALMKRNVVLLLSGQLVSELGSVMQSFALSLYVFTKTQSGVAFTSVLAVAIIPRFFGPFTGVLTDRVNRKRMLILLDVAAGIVTLGFALWHRFAGALPLTFIYVFVILLAAIQTFYMPTVTAIIPELVGNDQLKQTNVASSVVSSIALILGPIIAPILLPGTDAGLMGIMLINFTSFLFAALIECFFKNRSAVDVAQAAGEPIAAAFREGLRTVYRNKELLMIVALSIGANFTLYSVFSAGVPIIMLDVVKVDNQLFGISKSLQSIGPVLGSILAGVLLKKTDYRKMLTRILALDSALLAAMAASIPLGAWLFADPLVWQFISVNLLMLFIVATVVLADIAITVAMQRIVPGHLLGRVSGVDSSLSMIAIPLGQMLFSLLAENVSAILALGIFAAITLATGIFARVMYKPMLAREAGASASGSV